MGSGNKKRADTLGGRQDIARVLIILIFTCAVLLLPPVNPAHAIGVGPRAISVYGQGGSFITGTGNNGGISANSLAIPYKTLLDSSGNLYVSDTGNNRVLYYPAGSTTATRVYGQGGSFTIGNVNNGGTSPNSLNQPKGLALDSGGNLYVADTGNNRVLFFPAGQTTATRVYAQGIDFTSTTPNLGGISASTLNQPTDISIDSSGNLYVADTGNNRVLYLPSGQTTAVRVYGQGGSFTASTANNGGISANSLSASSGIALDGSGNLYVSDATNSRVLYFPSGQTTAVRVYGQGGSFITNTVNNGGISANSLSNPSLLVLDPAGNLYVSDASNNRMLYFPAGQTTANRVYGQANSFTSNTANNGGLDAVSLLNPMGIIIDSSGNIYLADSTNNRVLKFRTSLVVVTQPPPSTAVNATFSLSAGLGDVGSAAAFSDFNGTISVAIKAGSGTSGAVLAGTTSIATISGVATFSNLSINTAGSGYILTTSSAGLIPATTNAFTIAGPLLLTYLTSPSFTFTLTGATGNITSQHVFKVNDTTQSGLGWHLNITSTQFTAAGGKTLATTANTITAVSTACTAGQACVLPVNGTTGYPITVPAAAVAPAPVTYYSANKGTGTGDVTITTTFSLSIAPGTASGTYTSIVSETLVNSSTPVYALNSGGASVGTFAADGFMSGGSTYSAASSIDTSAVSNPAPQAVYQTERFGNFTYTLPGLTVGAQYTVRLHFVEIYWTSTGQRVFNVSINGVQVLTSFDIIAATGGIDKAIVKQFTTTANASGQIVIVFTTITNNAKVSGIEILAN